MHFDEIKESMEGKGVASKIEALKKAILLQHNGEFNGRLYSHLQR